MTHGSLFSGVGGFDLGFERAGLETIWQVENDPYAIRVLEKHWPEVRRHDDIRTFPPDGSWPTPDIISGGFPCQDLSVAGKRAGIDASRSGLWWEMLRVIRVMGPRIVCVENVPGLLSGGGGEWAGAFFGSLADAGFDCAWTCLPAAAVGAPHLRYRVFVVAYAQRPRSSCSRGGDEPESAERGAVNAGAEDVAYAQHSPRAPKRGQCAIASSPGDRRQHDGTRGATDAEREESVRGTGSNRKDVAYADGQRPQGRVGSELCECAGEQPVGASGSLAAFRATVGRAQWGHDPADVGNTDESHSGTLRAREDKAAPTGLPECSGKQRGRDTGPVESRVGRVAHGLPRRVDGFVPRVATGIPDRVSRLRCLGNSVVPQVAQWIGQRILEAEGGE